MIDLTKAIEAVHKDGRVVPMEYWETHLALIYTKSSPDVNETSCAWRLDGTDAYAFNSPWTIRNVTDPDEPTDPDDWAIEEALKRGEWVDAEAEDIREMASLGYTSYRCVLALARMIQKYEPHLKPKPPVDPDVAAVREILAAHYTSQGARTAARKYRAGVCDEKSYFLAAVEAFKRVKGGVL